MIKFYTNNCPKCQMIKQIMDKEEIEYKEITDLSIVNAVARENGIMSMPFAETEDAVINTEELQLYIKNSKWQNN